MDAGEPIQETRGESEQVLAGLAGLLNPEVDPAPHLAGIAACLDHPEEPVRLLAAVVLGRIGANAIPSLIRGLVPEQPATVRVVAALGLASLGPPAAGGIRELCRCLTSPDDGLRSAASVALGKIGAPAASSLELMLRFPDPNTLSAAVSALAMIGPPAAQSAGSLDGLAARAPVPLQLACAAALARITGDPARGLPILLGALSSPDPAIRKLSLDRIGELQEAGGSAAPYLLHSLGDPDAGVRAAAALAMGRTRVPAAHSLPPLIRLLDDPAPEVRVHASIALSALGREAAQALPQLRAHGQDPDANVAAAANAAAGMIEKAS
jgi:HEAT repeat protein